MAGRNALIDALQSASNTTADTVSAPVNALAWMLRKAGVPVPQNALGSSDWMAQQGLTREVPQGVPRMIGETAGLVLPMVAAAKAPQIAAGLNQALSNAQIPQRMNPQRGAIVYHGSPHKFDAFDASKIGTGEGAQAYGHGLYLAEAKNVADEYAGKLSKKIVAIDGFAPSNIHQQILDRLSMRANATTYGQGGRAIWDDLQSVIRSGSPAEKAAAREIEAKAGFLGGKLQVLDAGNLYKVDLPDEQIARMLDWDKPINEAQRVPLSRAAMKQFGSGLSGTSGEHLYKEVLFEFKNAGHPNPVQAATEWLRANGAPGIRYLDGGSRNAGSGTSNFVVFPGEENALRILERNGAPLGK